MAIDFLTIAKIKMAERSPTEAAQLIRAVLIADSEYEQWLHRDLLLAGWCLTQAPAGLKEVDSALVDGVLDRLVAIEINDWVYVPSEVIQQLELIFHEFAVSPFRNDIWDRLKKSVDKIEQFRFLLFQQILQNQQSFSDALLYLFGNEDASISDCAPFYIATNWEKMQSGRLESALLQLLHHPLERVQLRTVQFLSRLETASEETIEALLPLLNHKRHFSYVCKALGKLGRGSDKVTEALLDALTARQQNKYWTERGYIVSALGDLGNSDAKVILALKDMIKQNDDSIYNTVAKSLISLGQSDSVALEILPLMQDNDIVVRSSTASALGELQNSSISVLNCLQVALQDPKSDVRHSAVVALEKLGTATPEVIRNLVAVLEDENEWVRSGAATALRTLEANSDLVIDRLLAMTQDNDWVVRETVVEILSQFQSRQNEVERTLLNLTSDENSYVRSQAIQAIGDLGNVSESTYDRLLQLADVDDSEELWYVTKALGNIGYYTQAAEDALIKLTKHQQGMVRCSAADALGSLNNISIKIVTVLLALLSDADVAVYCRARDALMHLGQQFPMVIPPIAQYIEQQVGSIAGRQAIDALWSILE